MAHALNRPILLQAALFCLLAIGIVGCGGDARQASQASEEAWVLIDDRGDPTPLPPTQEAAPSASQQPPRVGGVGTVVIPDIVVSRGSPHAVRETLDTSGAGSGIRQDEQVTAPVAPPGRAPVSGQERKVALLLPVGSASSEDRALALAMQNAARLAVSDLGSGAPTLRIHDTSLDAAAAAEEAIAAGAGLILGPLFASDVHQVAPLARNAGVPVIAFSNDPTVAQDFVYLIGVDPMQEFRHVIAYASLRGFREIDLIFPAEPYGWLAEDALVDMAATEPSVRIGSRIDYATDFDSVSQAAEKYVREQNVREQRAAEENDEEPSSLVNNLFGVSVVREPSRRALLIADSGSNLEVLAGYLDRSEGEALPIQYLGSSQWDTPEVLVNLALRGAWFAAPDPTYRNAFVRRYREAFDATPPPLAALSYDAVAIAGALAEFPGEDPFTRASIERADGFQGVTGIVRFLPNGTNERNLSILEIRRERIHVLEANS